MAAPVDAKKPAESSPFDLGEEGAPAEPEAPKAEEAPAGATAELAPPFIPTEAPPGVKVAPAAVPPSAPQQVKEEEPSMDAHGAHRILGRVLAGYNLGASLDADTGPYGAASPHYSGWMAPRLQLGYAVVNEGPIQFNLMLDFAVNHLSREKDQGAPDSSIRTMSLGVTPELKWFIGDNFGLGLGLTLGWLGYDSEDADVGAPHSATLEPFKEGGLFIGFQPHLHFWRGIIQAGFGIDLQATKFDLDTGENNPPLRMGPDRPFMTPYIGFDIAQAIAGRKRSRESQVEKTKAKREQRIDQTQVGKAKPRGIPNS